MKKCLLALLFSCSCWAGINKNGDFQIWTREFLTTYFAPVWGLTIYEENRIGDDGSTIYEIFLQGQIFYQPARWVSIAPGYRQSLRRHPLDSTHWRFSYIPLADVTFFGSYKKWEFHNRNRVQYIVFQSNPYPWLYRNRIRILPPWSFTQLNINPFFDNELFFRQGSGFNEDRISAGFMLKFTSSAAGELYYTCRLQKIDHPTHWKYQNILNISLLLAY